MHRSQLRSFTALYLLTLCSASAHAAAVSATQAESLTGKWLIRIDGGGEIYSARFNFKSDDSKPNGLRGDLSTGGKKAALRSVRHEDGLLVVNAKTRRNGLPVEVTFTFDLVENRMVGDVDFDSGTSVRSYEFEATRLSSEPKKELSQTAATLTNAVKSASQVEPQESPADTKEAPATTTAEVTTRVAKKDVSKKLAFQQGEADYAGTVDTEIWAIAPSKSLFEQGTMTADGNNGGGESQVLMRFADVFGDRKRQVPKLSRVVSAKLIVVAFDPGSTIYLHRMLVPWDDSATWDGMARGISVDNVEASTVRDGFNFGEINMDKQSIEFDVTATVQKWSNGEPNYGWVFTSTGSNGWDFYSSDWIEQDSHPRLEIEFEESTVGTDRLAKPPLKEARKP